MDEAKSLTHMALAAMISAAFLAAVFGLINLGHSMWKAMSQEDEANHRISTYANYCAYDNKIVRAQDIVQLAEEYYDDIWIAIYDSGEVSTDYIVGHTMKKMLPASGLGAPKIYMYNPNGYTGNSVITRDSYTSNTVNILDNTLSTFTTTFTNKTISDAFDSKAGSAAMLTKGDGSGSHDIANPDATGNLYDLAANGQFEGLQSVFLNNKNLYRISRKNTAEGKQYDYGLGYYAPFLSMLVYENDNTTDVIGVIFIRESGQVDPETVDENF